MQGKKGKQNKIEGKMKRRKTKMKNENENENKMKGTKMK